MVAAIASVLLHPPVLLGGRSAWTSMAPHGVGNILLVAAAPAIPATLYAATSTVLFRSTDGGETWSALAIPPAVTAFAADGRAPGVVYAGTSFAGGIFNPEAGAMYRSSDAGAHWTPGTGIRASVLSLVVDPHSSAVLYAGTSDGAWQSADSGATWSRVGASLPLARVEALAIDGSTPARLYAAGDGGVCVSADGGAGWAPAGGGLPALPVTALVADASRPSVLWAATNGGGVFRTAGGGGSWLPANTGLADLHVFELVADPSAPEILYAATNAGVFRWAQDAAAWTTVNDGLPSPFVAALAVDPAAPGTVYASVLGPGLFQATFATRAPRGVRLR